MPRQPTGRPRGRPKGSGELGEQTRLTVRIPLALYERLQAFAEGRVYTHGAPQLAICVREALEEYLACRQTGLAHKGQTKNVPVSGTYIYGQPINVQERVKDNLGQTKNAIPLVDTAPQGAVSEIRQTKNVPALIGENNGQTENGTTGYDVSKYTLGKLCPRGHEHGTTGQSLLRISNRHCLACDREKFHERKQAKRSKKA